MDSLLIEKKTNTPLIDLNSDTGLLKIIGRSIPENPVKFYEPVENWIQRFINTNPKDLTLSIYLDYLNTHSTECMLVLLKKLETYFKASNANVKIVWSFDEDDEDMEDLGKDLSSLIDIPFEYKEVIEQD